MNKNENEKRETLADIVAEMRMGDDGGEPAYRIGRAERSRSACRADNRFGVC